MSITKISPDVVDFDAGITISTADNLDTLTLTSTDADANAGPNLRLYRNSSSPADSDALGFVEWEGRNDNSQDVIYGQIAIYASDVSDGTEDSNLYMNTIVGGTVRNRINVYNNEVVINEESIDSDFRVEGDGNTHALFVQASDDKIGLGHSSPPNRLTILGDIDQTSSNVYAGNTKWGLLAETPTYSDGDYVGLIASTTGNNNATKPKFGIWGLHSSAGSRMYFGVSNDYGSGLNVNWSLKENGHFGPLASGHGIDFSATANSSGSMSSEVLDDYEEGTWTPVLGGASTAGTFSAGTGTAGRYIKIGKFCYVAVSIRNSTLSGAGGALKISGLPYATYDSNLFSVSSALMMHNFSFDTNDIQAFYAANDVLNGIESVNGGAWTDWNVTNTSALYLQMTCVYEVDE